MDLFLTCILSVITLSPEKNMCTGRNIHFSTFLYYSNIIILGKQNTQVWAHVHLKFFFQWRERMKEWEKNAPKSLFSQSRNFCIKISSLGSQMPMTLLRGKKKQPKKTPKHHQKKIKKKKRRKKYTWKGSWQHWLKIH